MSRKARVDSKPEQVKTMIASATRDVNPPAKLKLDEDELEIFDEIIAEFATIDWSSHSIRLAAILARTMSMMQEAQSDLASEGFTTKNARGNDVMNPVASAMNMMASQVMSMRRTLALHATAGAKKGDVGNRRNQRKAQEADNPLDDDDEELLAVPEGVAEHPTRARARHG